MTAGYFYSILEGSLLSIQVALGALVVAVVLGLAGAAAKLSTHQPLVWLGTIYSTIIRGIPDLVLMLLIFYGGQIGLNVMLESMGYMDYVEINPFAAGLMTIGFIYGAYMTETFRGAIMAIRSRLGLRHGPDACFFYHRIAANGALGAARLYKQLAGAHQGHCIGVYFGLARHDLLGQTSRSGRPRPNTQCAIAVYGFRRCYLLGLHHCVVGRIAPARKALHHGCQAR